MPETILTRIFRSAAFRFRNDVTMCRTRVRPAGMHPDGPQGDEGFTLLELLVVIAILGLLIGLVAPAALRQLGGARNSVAHQSIQRLGEVLDLYRLDMGAYPSTEDGLHALVERPQDAENWNGPYLKDGAEPKDPWHHPYVYASPSERPGHDYDLCSRGAHDTSDRAAMICNP